MNKKTKETLVDLLRTRPKKYKLLRIMMEENVSLSEALKRAGYSKSTQINPHLITNTDDFKEAAGVIMEDWYTNYKHEQILAASEIVTWKFDNKDVSEDVVALLAEQVGGELLLMYRENKQNKFIVKVPKHQEQRQALDMLYKLKGDYAAEKVELSSKFSDLTDEQIEELEKTNDLKISRFRKYGTKSKPRRTTKAKEGTKTGKAKKSSK